MIRRDYSDLMLVSVRRLERTDDPRVWPARARLRWPRKLGQATVVPRHGDGVLGLTWLLCSLWRFGPGNADAVPAEERIAAWVDWATKCKANIETKGRHTTEGGELAELLGRAS